MKNKLLCIIFILLLGAGVFVQFSPADVKSIESENRQISPMPYLNGETLKSGQFMTELDSHINDTVGYRSYFTAMSDKIKSSWGENPPTGKVLYTDKDIGTQTVKKACLLLLDDKIMEVFASDQETEKVYIDAVNECVKNIPQSINVYSLLAPTQLEFQTPVYRNIQTSQQKTIEHIYTSLDSRIKSVDAYGTLQKHIDEYIYFRTDHHWTALGAYYAYRAFCEAAGEVSVPLSDFEKRTQKESFLGYLAAKAEGEDFSESRDTLEWYNIDEKNSLTYSFATTTERGKKLSYRGDMFQKQENDYKFFFKSDHPYVKIKNNSLANGKVLLMIKDSYANAFAPWLTNTYECVIMVDPRYFKGDIKDVIKEDKVTDLVFMHYVFTTSFADYCKMMTNMWK